MLLAGFGAFLPKIIESQFSLSPAMAAVIVGRTTSNVTEEIGSDMIVKQKIRWTSYPVRMWRFIFWWLSDQALPNASKVHLKDVMFLGFPQFHLFSGLHGILHMNDSHLFAIVDYLMFF